MCNQLEKFHGDIYWLKQRLCLPSEFPLESSQSASNQKNQACVMCILQRSRVQGGK